MGYYVHFSTGRGEPSQQLSGGLATIMHGAPTETVVAETPSTPGTLNSL
jgi:hypothetical protein